MPAHIVLPHIDHENVSEAEDEERRLPLERLGRLAALDRVGALNVEKQQVRLRRRALHPDPTRGLRAPMFDRRFGFAGRQPESLFPGAASSGCCSHHPPIPE